MRRLAPTLVALAVAALVLGPALGRGVVLAYDLAWSPDARLTPFALGWSTPAPRAVPSDAAAVVLGWVTGAGVAQALVLLGILVLAGAGAGRLVTLLHPDAGVVARSAAAVAATWNPFVHERLVVGQWTVLLGYAAVPHLLVAAARVRRGEGRVWGPAVGLAACGLGGANTLVLGALVVGCVLAWPSPRWRALGLAVAATVGVSAVWAVPALSAGVSTDASGVAAFAARADGPLGVVGSLVAGGGFWNPASYPGPRPLVVVLVAVGLAVAAVAVAAHAARAQGLAALVVPAAVGLLLAWASSVDPFGAWSALVLHAPGGGLLRDAQKLVAPWVVLAAAGAGVLVHRALAVRAVGPALAVLLTALPVALLPTLAWGVGGRVTAVEVPADLRAAADRLSADGDRVGLLPWSQYRRYAWNGNRVSLTIVPRMVDAPVLADDGLPLASGRVPGEDPAAARVTAAIAAGTDPVAALRDEGVRHVLVERWVGAAGAGTGVAVPEGATVLVDSTHVLLLDLGRSAGEPEPPPTRAVVGWAVSSLTWLAALGLAGHAGRAHISRVRRGRRYRLVQSRP